MPEIVIPGPEGRIEARYAPGIGHKPPLSIILHPHPRQGGTMNNKVVYHAFQAFKSLGFATLRFNMRGVGKSQGAFDNGNGELADAACALDWLQSKNHGSSETWVTGFSFGAWLSLQLLMRRPEIVGFVAISPPANTYDFSFLSPCPSSGLIIQGSEDTIVEEDSVNSLAEKINHQKNVEINYQKIKGADHFFSEHLDKIRDLIIKYVNNKRS